MKQGLLWAPSKGMSRDVIPTRIEKGMSWANQNICSFKGTSLGGRVSESGTEALLSLDPTETIIGHIFVGEDELVYFTNLNKISLYNFITNTSQVLIEEEELNFSKDYPIHGVSKVIKGCERVIYFTDFNNPVRAINIDNVEQYFEESVFLAENIKLSSPIDFINFSSISVLNSGGDLQIGSYRFAYRFVDIDGNVTAWSSLSNRINIYEENSTNDWNQIFGNQNIVEYTEEEGGRPRTNKRILLTFENLSSQFESIQVVVVPFVQGLGTPDTPYTLQPRPISSNTLTVSITGSNSEVYEEITFTELITEKVAINKAKTLEQHDKSLWIGNIEEEVYDWAAFQQAANKIQVKIKKEQIPALEVVKGNSKHPTNGSLPPGEVVPLAVQFLLKNGTKTPAFHIPARNAVGVEKNIVSIWSQDVEHIASKQEFESSYGTTESEALTKPVIRNYEVRDYITDEGDGIYSTAYYEGTSTYPTTKACNGTFVFDSDINDNLLAGTPIRHHKIPSRSEIPMVEKVDDVLYINNLTFDFSNIVYPSEDVIGHIILQGVREDQDRTIVDSGYLLPMKERSSNDIQWYKDTIFPNDIVTTVHKFVGHHSYIDGIKDGDYLRIEYQVGITDASNETIKWDGLRGGLLDFSPNIKLLTLVGTYIDHEIVSLQGQGNYTIDNFTSVGQFSSNESALSKRVDNKNKCDEGLFFELKKPFTYFQDRLQSIPYVTIRRNVKPFDTLDSITYVPMQTEISSEITQAEIYGENVTSMFYHFNLQHPNDFFDGQGFNADHVVQYLTGLWSDGYYNASLLHSGTGDCNNRYEDIASSSSADYLDPNELPYYAVFRIAVLSDDGNEFIDREPGSECKEYYQYNYDFTSFNTSTPIFPLLSTYDYCKDCEGRRPDHLLFSQRDDQEDSVDGYRIFLANDYRKIDELGTDINKVMAGGDNLYVWTNHHLYYVPTKAQEIQTNEDTVFLGTGDRLSIPPRKMMELMPTYGGTSQIQGVIRTPMGIFFACPNRGAIYSLADKGIQEISGVRMKTWFRDHLPIQLKKYANVNYSHIQGDQTVGVALAYDPFHNRLLVQKKDYEPTVEVVTNKAGKEGKLYFLDGQFKRYKGRTIQGNDPYIVEDITTSPYFKDISWNISFDLGEQAWISFHDWKAEHYISLDTSLLSVQGEKVWTHTNPNDVNIHGEGRTTILSAIINENPMEEKQLIEAGLRMSTHPDNIWVWNDRYSTGQQSFLPKGVWTTSEAPITHFREMRDKYTFNKFTSFITTTPTQDGHFLIPNPENVDFNQSLFTWQPLQGRYFHFFFYKHYGVPLEVEDFEIYYRKAQL